MTCAEINEQLSAFVDDELNPRERAKVSAHLDACGACRQELQQLRATSQLLRGLPRPIAPPHIADSALELVRARAQAARTPWWDGLHARLDGFWRRFELRPLAVAAAVVAVLIVGAQIAKQNLPATKGEPAAASSAALSPPSPADRTPEMTGSLRVDDPQAAARAVQQLVGAQHGGAFATATGDVVAVVPRGALGTIEAGLAKLGGWQVMQRESSDRRDVEIKIRIVPRSRPH